MFEVGNNLEGGQCQPGVACCGTFKSSEYPLPFTAMASLVVSKFRELTTDVLQPLKKVSYANAS